jgi:hypothetical protein
MAFAAAFQTSVALAAEISDVKITGVDDGSATINWNTDISTDATVNFGIDPRVGIERDPLFDKKEHSIVVDRLDPATTYYFRVISTDAQGNKSATAGYQFTTKSNDKKTAKKAVTEIEKIKDPEALKEVIEEVQKVASDVIRPPSIQGEPKVIAANDHADIIWTTDRNASSMVYFAKDAEFDPAAANPYPTAQGDPNDSTMKHTITLVGLSPSTLYHYKVSSEDSAGMTGESEDNTFKTNATLPQIINPTISRIQETAATVSWATGGVLSKGVVEYTNLRSKVTKSAGNPVFLTNHSIQLSGLDFGTRYSVVITSTNEAGNEVASKPLTFLTVRDIVPPAIAKVNNESTLFPSEDVKIQTIISWETDEPSFCQVHYTQGLVLAAGEQGDVLPLESNPLTSHTQVIVGFAPATVYKFWMLCHDEADNEARSEDYVLITPVKEKSIIDIILENFQGTFGWLKNIKG